MKQDIILKVSNLTKKYGSFTAVRNLNMEVPKGGIFGFLGPNGAGKTTSINMICGLLKPDSGDVEIGGLSVVHAYDRVKSRIGLCPQNIMIWETLTCLEQLVFMGEVYNVDGREARKRSLELLGYLGLTEKKDKLAKTLSGGMQRRLNIALALVHQPEILILDEPQAGLDPQSRVLVRDYIRELSKKVTVILTTHDMDEAERLADEVAIMDRGELLIQNTPEKLKSTIGEGEILEIKLSDNQDKKMKQVLTMLPGEIQRKDFQDNMLSIISPDTLGVLPGILELLKNQHISIEDMKIRKKTLEDVFISLTGRGLRE